MCNKKSDILASSPKPRHRFSSSATTTTSATTNSATTSTSSTSLSLTNLKDSLADRPILYSSTEIRAATNNFHAKNFSASSWRCTLRGKDTVVFRRAFFGDPARVPDKLSSVSRSHHIGLVRLLGASVTAGDCIFLVYDHVNGAGLDQCLRNPRNAGYTLLPSWISRMQVAADVAEGLEYIHHHSGARRRRPIHNRIKSSAVIVTDPDLRGKICHFGTAELAGEIEDEEIDDQSKPRKRSNSRRMRIEGTRGYMAPEIIAGASPSQKTDVFAFGVVLLELLGGEQPMRYQYGKDTMESISLIDTARDVMGSAEEGEWEEERRRRLRRWVDRRLKDSFPVEVAEKVMAVALECVDAEAVSRPDMMRVAGRLSSLLLQSREWAEKFKVPTDFTVSMAPR